MNNLRFADDVIIIATSEKQITDMIQDVHRESEKVGLKINTSISVIIRYGLHNVTIEKNLPPIQCKEKTICHSRIKCI